MKRVAVVPGFRMLMLNDVDRQAVELFLESHWGGNRDQAARPAAVSERIGAVSQIFDRLGQMAAEAPPADLAARVMGAIERTPPKWQDGFAAEPSTTRPEM